jgi:phytoene dehydrogenase-like protein
LKNNLRILSEQSLGGQVVLADGTVVRAKQVLSNATPAVTFLKLMPDDILPDEFMTGVRCIDYKSGTTKINVAVDTLPRFWACPHSGLGPGPEHFGTIHLGADRYRMFLSKLHQFPL